MFAVTLFESFFLFTWFALFVAGCTADRRGDEGIKWVVLLIGVAIALVIWWSDWTFAGAWAGLFTAAFWKPVMYFLLIGLAYSAAQFGITIIKSARDAKAQWEKAKANKNSKSDFVLHYYQYYNNQIVKLKFINGDISPEVDKSELAASIGVWTCFWPFYLVSFVCGDILAEIWNVLAEFFSTLGGRMVKNAYKNIFN